MALLGFTAIAITASIAVAATASKSARISAPQSTIALRRERFGLAGSVPLDRGMDVRIKFRALGSERWRLVRKTHSDRNGIYRAQVRAPTETAPYMAVPGRGRHSEPERVTRSGREPPSTSPSTTCDWAPASASRVASGPAAVAPSRSSSAAPGATSRGTRSRAAAATRPGLAPEAGPAPTGCARTTTRNRRAKGSVSVARRVTAYRAAHASWYGPGFYGNRTACGQTLAPGMLGVANKSLPCGTKVKFRYRGRTVTAPVIDRGPYAAGREWDLTAATKQRLGFPDTGTLLRPTASHLSEAAGAPPWGARRARLDEGFDRSEPAPLPDWVVHGLPKTAFEGRACVRR